MFMLALHIVAIGVLIMFVWAIAFGAGRRAGERRLRRQLGIADEGAAPPSGSPDAT